MNRFTRVKILSVLLGICGDLLLVICSNTTHSQSDNNLIDNTMILINLQCSPLSRHITPYNQERFSDNVF